MKNMTMVDTTTNSEMLAQLKKDKEGTDNMKGKLSESCYICGKHDVEHLNNQILGQCKSYKKNGNLLLFKTNCSLKTAQIAVLL